MYIKTYIMSESWFFFELLLVPILEYVFKEW